MEQQWDRSNLIALSQLVLDTDTNVVIIKTSVTK